MSHQRACLGVPHTNQTFDKSQRPTPNSTQAKPGPALTSCWRFHNTRQCTHDVSETEQLDRLGRVVLGHHRLPVDH